MNAELRRALVHRLRSHEAGLEAARALGYPAELADAVATTYGALLELAAVLEIVDDLADDMDERGGSMPSIGRLV